MTEDAQDSQWHLDRKVPIALILAVLAQTFAFGWWGASISARVDNIEQNLIAHGKIPAHGEVRPRLTRIETRLDALVGVLTELRRDLRRRERTSR